MAIGRKILYKHNYYMNQIKIKSVEFEKDIGVIFDNELDFDRHITEKTNKAHSIYGMRRRTFTLCYADDLCLISLSSAGMQSLLDICNSYAIEHVLTYNSNKSYSLRFKPKHIKFARPCFYLNRLEIPRVDQCKFLGIMICTKNCDIDLKRQMRKFYANINILSRMFAKCSPDVKCTLFKSFCSNMYNVLLCGIMELLLL